MTEKLPEQQPAAKKKAAPRKTAAKSADAPAAESTPAAPKPKAAVRKTVKKEESAAETPAEKPKPAAKKSAAKETPAEPKPAAKKRVVKKAEPTPPAIDDDAEEKMEAVDFSDEEAQLAADAPEFDLGDKESEEEDGERGKETADLSGKSKKDLLDIFAELLSSKPVQGIRREVEGIKVAFYKLHRAEVEEHKKGFVEAGGNPEEFIAPADAQEQRLKELFADYRKRRDEYLSGLERTKEENLQIKLKIIEDLKALVDSSETVNNTFNAFRELQQRWKEAGPVPQANVKDLWETYNLHVENFYSFIKINKELRDLDLKRNYEAKLALCEEAEALVLEPSVVNAFHKLQKLHEQWRETGPVANEYKESLWARFREASGRINKQHQEYFDALKGEQKANFDLKTELCVKAEELTQGVMTTRKDWNKASESLLEIQKVWKTIGFAPKKDNARIYERFRTACDRFFEQKRNFYIQMKTEMDHNLHLKTEICEAAEAVKNSDQWKKTTDELIELQKKWKEIGPVPRRHSDVIWKRFRTACDNFFERKSKHFSSVDSEHGQNLENKRSLLAEIRASNVAEGGFDMIKEFQRRWSEIGFVPIKQKDAIQKEYKEVMDALFATLRGNEHGRQMDRFRGKVQTMKSSGGGDKRLRFERDRLYNKVKQLESDIALLENNIGFFSKSKNAESMIKDVMDKIERAKKEMAETIEKVNLIDNQQ